MNTRRNLDQRGVTLLELMVSILASSIIILSVGRIATTNSSMIREGQDQARLQQDVSRLLDRITRDVRAAERVTRVGATGFRTYVGAATQHVYTLSGSGNDLRLQRDGVVLLDCTCSTLAATSTSDSTTLDIRLSMTDEHGNRAEGYTAAVVRNNNLGF